ncbi:MAG TPA: hypothetical protein VN040_14195 [Pseudosphingobacterium sp.]|nr:hypothetical protein [Pseudosphingobacterium sp.]
MKKGNRVADAYKALHKQQDELKKDFRKEVIESRLFRMQTLKEYNRLLAKFSKGLQPHEKFYRQLLNRERRLLEKELYPNVLLRLALNLYKLTKAIAVRTIASPKNQQKGLKDNDHKYGFADGRKKAEQFISKGYDSFTIPLTRSYTPTEQVDYSLNYTSNNGATTLDHYTAKLTVAGKPEDKKQVRVEIAEGQQFDERKAYNLLAGRFVKNDNDSWNRIDWNDRDAEGNFKIKEFTAVDFNLIKEVNKLPGFDRLDGIQLAKVVQGLEKGERLAVTIDRGTGPEQVNIQVHPIKRLIEAFDGQNRKIKLDEPAVKEQNKSLKEKQTEDLSIAEKPAVVRNRKRKMSV